MARASLRAVIEPTGGRMVLRGETRYNDGWKIPDLRTLRRDSIRFVFQAPYLIPFLDVTDSAAILPMFEGRPNGEARQCARDSWPREKIRPTFKRLYQIRDGSTHEEAGKCRSL